MIFENIAFYISTLSVEEGRAILEPLALFVIGMTIFSIFIYKFYKLISRKDIFRITEGKGSSTFHKIAYALEYIFLFPVIAFLWFFVVSMLLTAFSDSLPITTIFLISMAILATIRLTAYYSEELSQEIAKLLPLALLAMFLLDINIVSAYTISLVISQLYDASRILVYYFIFILSMELLLRLISDYNNGVKSHIRRAQSYRD